MNVMSAIDTPGGSVAAQLLRRRRDLRIAVIEPSETHSYQPDWTLVGAGVFTRAETERREASVTPKSVTGVRQAVRSFRPELKRVERTAGSGVGYDHLVFCPGLQLGRNRIKSLSEALDSNGACYADYTSECIRVFHGGKVTPSFPLDPRAPRTGAWLLKTKLLPVMYWQLMLRGNTFEIKHRERPRAVAG